jgi:hypothetical protein
MTKVVLISSFLLMGFLAKAQEFQGKAEYFSKMIYKNGIEEVGVKSDDDENLKNAYKEAIDSITIDAKKELEIIEKTVSELETEKKETTDIGKRSDISDKVRLLNKRPYFYKNLIKAYENNGDSVSFTEGDRIDILQSGAGQVTLTPAAGVTLNSDSGKRKLLSQWAACTLIKRGANSWVAIGNLTD